MRISDWRSGVCSSDLLKFAFWENIFTVGQDSRIWNAHFRTCFPGAPQGQPTPQCRATAYADLQIIRRLRNRIAHHEPIFMRNIADDYQRIRSEEHTSELQSLMRISYAVFCLKKKKKKNK